MKKLLALLILCSSLFVGGKAAPVEAVEPAYNAPHPEWIGGCKVTYSSIYHLSRRGAWGYCSAGNEPFYVVVRCYDINERYIKSVRGYPRWPGSQVASYGWCGTTLKYHTHSAWIVAGY